MFCNSNRDRDTPIVFKRICSNWILSKNILRLKCHTHDLSCIVSRVIFLLSNKYLNLLIFENYVFNLILLPLIFVSSFRVVRISLELYFL